MVLCVSQIGDWVAEKMLMARDTSRDETQKLHKKWLKHQTFMAELAQNKEWLDKIENVSSPLKIMLCSLSLLIVVDTVYYISIFSVR